MILSSTKTGLKRLKNYKFMMIDNIIEGIFRLKIPFEDLTTSVYFYISDEGVAIIDNATYSSDVDNYIMPALKELKINPADVKYLLLTHSHGDHAGGTKRLSQLLPNAKIGASFETGFSNQFLLQNNMKVLGNLIAVFLPGHTENSFGFLDIATKTLLSGDCLQLNGIGKYRNNVANAELYKQSVLKLKNMNIERIVAAHEFEPLGSLAVGKNEVIAYLEECLTHFFRK